MKTILHIIFFCTLFVAIAFTSGKPIPVAGNSAIKPPNVVIIFMDDMGYGDPVCFGGGPYQTPNIDALAASGMRLTQFYAAQAVCSASRSALLTGCYPTRISMHGALSAASTFALNPDEQTIAELLKDKGYKTGMVGKWHLGHVKPFLPLQQGFDEYYGLPYSNDMWPYNYGGEPYPDTSLPRSKHPPLPLIDGNTVVKTVNTFDDQDQLTTDYTTRAVSFINKHKNDPFFLYFAHSMVHVPLGVSAKYKGKSGAGLFGDVMEEVDWSVGEVVKTLKANKLLENTIIIFTSDNGPWLSFGNHAGNTGGLREGKGTAWEGGLKVPAIISWPGTIKAGTVCNKLMTTMDLLPTIVNISGAKMPVKKIDGVDFTRVLKGDLTMNPREEFAYYYNKNSLKGIRKGNWKLMLPGRSQTYGNPGAIGKDRYPGKTIQDSVRLALYDLTTDPGEDRDLKAYFPEIVQQLTAVADKYRTTIGDELTGHTGTEVRPAGVVGK